MFRHRNTKVYSSKKRVTLDAKHNEIIDDFKSEKKNLGKLQKKEKELSDNLSKLKEENRKSNIINIQIENQIITTEKKLSKVKKDIEKLSNDDEKINYFVKTGKILYEYYNDIDNVAQKNSYIENKNILKFFNTNNDNDKINEEENDDKKLVKISDFINKSNKFDRAAQLDSFMKEIDESYCSKTIINKNLDYCPKCLKNSGTKNEMLLNQTEGTIYCQKCGYIELIVIDSDKPSYKDPPPEATYFAYKRINHFNELLAQIQAKESTDIPQEVFNKIINEIKKERINDLSKLSNEKIRSFLKKLGLNKYYEHVPHIINKLNGLPPPILTRDIEERLRIMFKEIQGPFMEICPKNRKNFLNYYYVFHKFVELLSLDEYKSLFPLLKSREKLHQQDIMWKKICAKLNWEYIKSI